MCQELHWNHACLNLDLLPPERIVQVLLCIALPVDAGLMLANPVSIYNRYSDIWKSESVLSSSTHQHRRKLKYLWLLEHERKIRFSVKINVICFDNSYFMGQRNNCKLGLKIFQLLLIWFSCTVKLCLNDFHFFQLPMLPYIYIGVYFSSAIFHLDLMFSYKFLWERCNW